MFQFRACFAVSLLFVCCQLAMATMNENILAYSKEEEEKIFRDSVLVKGPYFSGENNDYGRLIDRRGSVDGMTTFDAYVNSAAPHVKLARFRGTDGEGIDVMERFFWGQDNGLVVELGELQM